MKKILIIQPYIPGYRREFFSLLHEVCLKNGLDLKIFATKPDQSFSLRNDSAPGLSFITDVGIKRVKFFNRQIDSYKFPSNFKISNFDVVIMEQTLKNMHYPLALMRKKNGTKIALWGHGRTIVKKKSSLEKWLQLRLSKRADFIFTYTSSGRDYLINNGYQSNLVIAVRNSNSSVERINRLENLKKISFDSSSDVEIRCCFIGALEKSKGLEVLFEVLPIIKRALPNFRFTFIGDGPDRDQVSDFSRNSNYVNWLGYKTQEEIDHISKQFTLILNPGRVGLIAVDSLMLLLPIVTLSSSYHAPEYEYISGNSASVAISGGAYEYAWAVFNLLKRPEDIQKMRKVCADERENYTLENMVLNFVNGILKVVSQGDKHA